MTEPSKPIGLTALGVLCALGNDGETVLRRALAGDTSGMRRVSGVLPNGDVSLFGFAELPKETEAPGVGARSRCERLTAAAYAQIASEAAALKARYTPARIGVVLGTSNSTMEEFTANPDHIDMGTPAEFLKKLAGVEGPAYVVSTACSSSAKAFGAARRLIENDVCDAVLVGGVDAYTRAVLNGFYALEVLSPTLARPLGENRTGINLGEGAAIFVMERSAEAPVLLLGVGESSDAYHLTAPDPEGRGALAAMQAALDDAGITPGAVEYVNLHGTGTMYNDRAECGAVASLFGENVAVSSTKPLTGHTLGAAGAIDAALCWLMLKHGSSALPHVLSGARDAALPPLPVVPVGAALHPRTVISTSFAFGGSNAAVLLGNRLPHYSMERLLAHRKPMILISDYDDDSFSAAGMTVWAEVSEDDVFYDSVLGGTPPCTALEYMAQSVACYVGLTFLRQGEEPPVGFVLGSRSLKLDVRAFVPGVRYSVHVAPQFSDGRFSSFETSISDAAGRVIAAAALNVFRPETAELEAIRDGRNPEEF